MNGEIEVLNTNIVIFPVKPREEEVTEVKSVKNEEQIETEVRAIETQTRFARFKKTLRKRSRSIL